MNRLRTAIAVALAGVMSVLVLGVGACGSSDDASSDTAAPEGKTVKVDPIANAQTQSIRVGDTITAELPGNPSTGYMWEPMLDDDGIIETAGDASFEAGSDDLGSPGAVTIPLKAAKAGYAMVLFKELPPGEPNGTPANISALSFDVGEAEGEATTLDEDMSAQETVELAVGDTLEVQLPGNESTGYSWVEDMAYMDDAVLVADGEPAFEADSEDVVGSPGTYTLKWSAKGPGDVIVIVKYVPPGDDGVPESVWVAWVSVKE
jgi:predicted secreted protein